MKNSNALLKASLILASASSRRLDLLKQIQIIPDQICPADIDEREYKHELPRDVALRLATQKAQAVAAQYIGAYVLGADTVVACGRCSLPKTEDEQSARKCLKRLSGRRHHVYGGIALVTPTGQIRTRVVDTLVQFKRLTRQDIDNYIRTKEWSGVAGGYAIQGYAGAFIKSIRGSYSNVVGLSLYDTLVMLEGSGYGHSN